MLDTLPLPVDDGLLSLQSKSSPVRQFHLVVRISQRLCYRLPVCTGESLRAGNSESLAIKAYITHTNTRTQHIHIQIVWASALAICYHSVLCGNRKLNTKLNFRRWEMGVIGNLP